jgi:hypothetical protein
MTPVGRRYRWWRGPQPKPDEEQIANARDGLFPFTPASDAPRAQTVTNWSALLPGQTVPLIWEDYGYGRGQEDE